MKPATALRPPEPLGTHPVELIEGQPEAGLVLVCDHASPEVPPDLDDLGLPPDAFARHIAYDIGAAAVTRSRAPASRLRREPMQSIDPAVRTELEAAAFRRLLQHLAERSDVQNIDLMNLAGFCRNCLSNWLKEAADARGAALSKEGSRTHVYGMPYETWKAKHQPEATPEQRAAFEASHQGH